MIRVVLVQNRISNILRNQEHGTHAHRKCLWHTLGSTDQELCCFQGHYATCLDLSCNTHFVFSSISTVRHVHMYAIPHYLPFPYHACFPIVPASRITDLYSHFETKVCPCLWPRDGSQSAAFAPCRYDASGMIMASFWFQESFGDASLKVYISLTLRI